MPTPVVSRKLVFVDCTRVLDGIERIEDLIKGDKNDVLRYAARELERETNRAFSQKVNPHTGAPWPERKHSYPWPLLNNTGTLKGVLSFAWGVTKRDNSPRVFGKVKDVVYTQRSFRGGRLNVGARYGTPGAMHKSAMEVVGSVFYGRRTTRYAEGFRQRRMGRGRITNKPRWSYGGGKGYGAAETGETPPRPFFGFSGAATMRVKRFAERMVARVYNKAS